MEKAPLKIAYLVFVLILFAIGGFSQPSFATSASEEFKADSHKADCHLMEVVVQNPEKVNHGFRKFVGCQGYTPNIEI